MNDLEAITALRKIIKISRVHLYKPIQVAEVLYRARTVGDVDPDDMDSYRTRSKKWRDDVTKILTGSSSSSSARFQDNVFEVNAVPPQAIKQLIKINNESGGAVEKYIYRCFEEKHNKLHDLYLYIRDTKPADFTLRKFTEFFSRDSGLKRSMDKAYEIAVYALFEVLVRNLGATVTVAIASETQELISEFEDFTRIVLGLDADNTSVTAPARLFRAGVTNAADRGLDIWANFGPAVQVKHVTLDPALASTISTEIPTANIVIVCRKAEEATIAAILSQVGFSRVKGIITEDMLEKWYDKALRGKHALKMGEELLNLLGKEFEAEFPSNDNFIDFFVTNRGYDKVADLPILSESNV